MSRRGAWEAIIASRFLWSVAPQVRGGVMLIEHPTHWCRADLERIGHRGAWDWFVMTGYLAQCHVGRMRHTPPPFSWSVESSALSRKLRDLLRIEGA